MIQAQAAPTPASFTVVVSRTHTGPNAYIYDVQCLRVRVEKPLERHVAEKTSKWTKMHWPVLSLCREDGPL